MKVLIGNFKGKDAEVDLAFDKQSSNAIANSVVTEAVDQLNNNLDGLEYSEIAGGKNLFKEYIDMNGYSISNEKYNGYPVIYKKGSWNGAKANTIIKAGKTYAVTVYAKGTGQIALYGSTSFTAPARTITSDWIRYGWVISVTSDTNELRVENVSDSGETYIACMQIEEGTTETQYEPYIPSVKMLADEVSEQNDSLSVIGKCKNLLNPTLVTETTSNGITCTPNLDANGNFDGTYTLNGTASSRTIFTVKKNVGLSTNKQYRLVGCPKQSGNIYYHIGLTDNLIDTYRDNGKGINFINKLTGTQLVYIGVEEGATVSNVILKPMITENLNTTYDDFVPYTGDGETLTEDVADLKSDLSAYADGTKAVAKATTADSATKATQDANGNVIARTYATKTDLSTIEEKTFLNHESEPVDLNNFKSHPSLISVGHMANNAPIGFRGGYMIVVQAGMDESLGVYQSLVDVYSNTRHIRAFMNDIWGEWITQ